LKPAETELIDFSRPNHDHRIAELALSWYELEACGSHRHQMGAAVQWQSSRGDSLVTLKARDAVFECLGAHRIPPQLNRPNG
jgi:hypothetical protein